MNIVLTIYGETDPNHVVFHSSNRNEIRTKLSEIGIFYERWAIDKTINEHSNHEQILVAYDTSIKALIEKGGYQFYDVIALNPQLSCLKEL